MPIRKKGEPLKKYVKRAVRVRQHEHPGEKIKQSVAISYSMGRKKSKKK